MKTRSAVAVRRIRRARSMLLAGVVGASAACRSAGGCGGAGPLIWAGFLLGRIGFRRVTVIVARLECQETRAQPRSDALLEHVGKAESGWHDDEREQSRQQQAHNH